MIDQRTECFSINEFDSTSIVIVMVEASAHGTGTGRVGRGRHPPTTHRAPGTTPAPWPCAWPATGCLGLRCTARTLVRTARAHPAYVPHGPPPWPEPHHTSDRADRQPAPRPVPAGAPTRTRAAWCSHVQHPGRLHAPPGIERSSPRVRCAGAGTAGSGTRASAWAQPIQVQNAITRCTRGRPSRRLMIDRT